MRNSMIIQSNQGIRQTLFVCSSRRCPDFDEDAEIVAYYSVLHAKDSGWLFTADIKHHDPSSDDKGSWVCHDCISGDSEVESILQSAT